MKAAGLSNRQIGKILGIGETTVRRAGASNDAATAKQPKKTKTQPDDTASNDSPLDATSAIRADAELRRTAEKQHTPMAKTGACRMISGTLVVHEHDPAPLARQQR